MVTGANSSSRVHLNLSVFHGAVYVPYIVQHYVGVNYQYNFTHSCEGDIKPLLQWHYSQ